MLLTSRFRINIHKSAHGGGTTLNTTSCYPAWMNYRAEAYDRTLKECHHFETDIIESPGLFHFHICWVSLRLSCSDTQYIFLGPLSLTLFNFNPSMDKLSDAQQSMEWNYLSIPKIQRLHRYTIL